jgi:GntR family transcriptional regulator
VTVFAISPSTGQPLYLQLKQQLRHAVETGVLRAGDPLPSIRTLAAQLVVSPNTVIKAYNELEREGLLDLRQGAGAFVAEHRDRAETRRMQRARSQLESLVDRLLEDGFSADEIQRLVEAVLFYRPQHTSNAKTSRT